MRSKRLLWLAVGVLPMAFSAAAYAVTSVPSDVSNAPTVNLLSPKQGSVHGGTKVAVIGNNLDGATAVDFGSTPATTFSVDSDNSITAVAPGGTGSVDVTVTTPSGVSQTSSADVFTYVSELPTVSAVMPHEGSILGGTRVTIIGTGFGGTLTVDFGSTPSPTFKETGGNVIVAQSPPGTAGTVDVTVTTSQGTSLTSTADEYTYVAQLPSVHLVVPNRGATSGGTNVTILGGNFKNVTAVDFGSTPATGFNVNSGHQITAVSPAGSGTVNITVTTTQGVSSITPNDQFAYGFPAPTVTFIQPSSGDALGGQRVTVVGTGLVGTTVVDFGTTPATRFTVNSDQSLTATAPAGTGTVAVTVTTPQGTSAANSSDQFTYVDHPPNIKLVVPNSGNAGGGNTVTIVGNNFKDATAVDFGSAPASFEVNTNSTITATAPAGGGTVNITVTTPQGVSAITAADEYTYTS